MNHLTIKWFCLNHHHRHHHHIKQAARRATHHLDVQFAFWVVNGGQRLQERKHDRLAAGPAADQQPDLDALFIRDASQLSVNVGPVPAEGATRETETVGNKISTYQEILSCNQSCYATLDCGSNTKLGTVLALHLLGWENSMVGR